MTSASTHAKGLPSTTSPPNLVFIAQVVFILENEQKDRHRDTPTLLTAHVGVRKHLDLNLYSLFSGSTTV